MIEWASAFGINTLIGGLLGLLIGHILNEQYVPRDHGAGQPQRPGNKEFITDDNSFLRWLVVEFVSFFVGAAIGNLAGPTILSTWGSMKGLEQFVAIFVLTLIAMSFLYQVYQSDVYQR